MVVRWRTHTLPIRSYVLVDRPPEPRCLVLGFHGYGERPAHCLEGLRGTGLEDALLVGPMGQHLSLIHISEPTRPY